MGAVVAKIVFKSGTDKLPNCERSLQDIEILDIDGNLVRMGDILADKKAVMFVNVATKWGLTADNYR